MNHLTLSYLSYLIGSRILYRNMQIRYAVTVYQFFTNLVVTVNVKTKVLRGLGVRGPVAIVNSHQGLCCLFFPDINNTEA
jgi:hypothetical protein